MKKRAMAMAIALALSTAYCIPVCASEAQAEEVADVIGLDASVYEDGTVHILYTTKHENDWDYHYEPISVSRSDGSSSTISFEWDGTKIHGDGWSDIEGSYVSKSYGDGTETAEIVVPLSWFGDQSFSLDGAGLHVDVVANDNGAIEESLVVYDFESEAEDGTVTETENGTTIVSAGPVEFEEVGEENGKGLSFDLTDPFELATESVDPPSISNEAWSEYPVYYDFQNIGQVESAAQWGAWGGNAGFNGQTYSDINNNDLQNAFSLYTDGESVTLHITYAGLFVGTGNGSDYNFTFNGNPSENAKFVLTLDNGQAIDPWVQLEPGTYNVRVKHGDGSVSWSDVEGATGTLVVKEGNLHNETEITIPISEMVRQNNNINDAVIQTVQFYSPNVMTGSISVAGASTAPAAGSAIVLLTSGLGAFLAKRRYTL